MDKVKEECTLCNNTGVIKYKELDEFAFRQWTPWLTKPCPNCCEHKP